MMRRIAGRPVVAFAAAFVAVVTAAGGSIAIGGTGRAAAATRTGGGPIICPKARSTPEAPVSYHPSAHAPQLPLAFTPNAGASEPEVQYLARGAGFGVAFGRNAIAVSSTTGTRGEVVQLVPQGRSPHTRLEARRAGPGRINELDAGDRRTGLPTYEEIVYRELWPGIDMMFRAHGAQLQYEFHLQPGADPSRIQFALRGAKHVSRAATGHLLAEATLGTMRESRPRAFQRVDGVQQPVEAGYRVDGRASSFGVELGTIDARRSTVLGGDLTYSTHLGGTSNDFGIAIAVDGEGSAYVTGQTISPDFPTTPGVFDAGHHGSADAFVAKLDPAGTSLVYATFLGGTQGEAGLAITVDQDGQAYVSGGTSSPDFPTTTGAFDTSHNGFEDVWVVKLDAAGTRLLYSTFLGGSEIAGDFGAAIAVDDAGRATVSGGTGSPNFPTTRGAFDTTHNGPPTVLDVFVARLNASGSGLVYSTFVGGVCSDAATGIALDPAGNTYVTGGSVSPDLPTTRGAFRPRRDVHKLDEEAFVAKVNAKGSKLLYSTYLGGRKLDRAQAIALDARTNAYVTGWTESPDFPTTEGSFDPEFNGGEDAFVTKLDAKGSRLVYSTYLGGGSPDRGRDLAIDAAGSAYVTGSAGSTDFPTTKGSFDPEFNGGEDAFVTKLDAKGSRLVYSTFLGGSLLDFGRGIAVDRTGSAYVTGRAESPDFPGSEAALSPGPNGGRDVFVTKLGPDGRLSPG